MESIIVLSYPKTFNRGYIASLRPKSSCVRQVHSPSQWRVLSYSFFLGGGACMEVQETEVFRKMSHVKKQKSKIHEISLACRLAGFLLNFLRQGTTSLRHPVIPPQVWWMVGFGGSKWHRTSESRHRCRPGWLRFYAEPTDVLWVQSLGSTYRSYWYPK